MNPHREGLEEAARARFVERFGPDIGWDDPDAGFLRGMARAEVYKAMNTRAPEAA